MKTPGFSPSSSLLIRKLALLLLLFSLCINAAASNQALQAYQATYQSKYKGFTLSAKSSLMVSDKEIYELTMSTNALVLYIDESSRFILKDKRLRPLNYRYKRSGIGRNKLTDLRFDWNARKVISQNKSEPWQIDLPLGTLDNLSYQLQLRLDLIRHKGEIGNKAYQVLRHKRIKTYQFDGLGEEQLDSPLGRFNTVKIKRYRKGKERETLIWLAKDWDYFLVKLVQTEPDGKSYELLLKEASLGGVSIQGLK